PVEGKPGVVTLEAEVKERCARTRGLCGDARATAYATLLWEKGLFPSPDAQQPAAVYLRARAFPLSVAQPLVTPTVSKLDGRITGAARLAYREIPGREVAFDIDMRLDRGVVHVPLLGQEFYDVRGHIRAVPGIVKVDDIHARAAGGEMTGKLSARFDGLEFKDLVAELSIDEKTRMPIRLQGAPLGTASVEKVVITAHNEPEALSVAPVIHGLRLEVPPTHDVQELEDHPEVHISHIVAPPPAEQGPGAKPVHLTVHIDRSELYRGQLRIGFRTRKDAPIVYETDTGEMDGIIELTGGQILLLGKMFRIERGHVRFRREEPTNPFVSMTARWDGAADNSTVFIDYIGPLKPIDRDKIHFRSNPPRPQDEIVALILFGEDDAGVTSEVNSEGGGRNLGSRIVAQQINDVLGEMVPGLSTAFGTDDEASRASLIYHFSDRVSAAATYESERQDAAAGTGSQNDPNKRNTRLSIDWRFAPNFVLRGSIGVGDEPSSGLDVLWQYRY
ncbi:MAG TPA: translocation/assembly module TamB domain-containing protein, partial [Polyangiaceae bacterium]|nr:translocation/assembly module TamB domain-containing protein [Polyangiaceae bacterium]